MKLAVTSPPSSSCLTPVQLQALLSADDGSYPDLDEHLQQCPRCTELLDAFDEPSDALIQTLSAAAITDDDEPALRELQEQLLASPTTVDAEAAAALFPPVADRLARPRVGPLPAQLGSYELIACIGRGASGAVYRARHSKLDRDVAVKVLEATARDGAAPLARILNEMKNIGRLTHPNIIRATDAGEVDGLHFLVMEYVDGVDASRLLRLAGPLSAAEACEIVRQAALGLQFAHEHALVHRDVKPANLLVTVGGEVKLLDLGIAAHTAASTTDQCGDSQAPPVGTAGYMAPEQWDSSAPVDARADIYSLGCTLLKMLTGKLPAPEAETEADRVGEARELLATRCPTAPRSLNRLVIESIAFDPKRRPQSSAEVARRLQPLARGADLAARIATVHAGADWPARKPLIARFQSWPPATRRVALVTAAAGVAAAWWMPWGRLFAPQLQRVKWRELAAGKPEVLLAGKAREQVQCEVQDDGVVMVDSAELVLIQLGRPVVGRFVLQVGLQQELWHGDIGLFFQGRQNNRVRPSQFEFQTIEMRPPDPVLPPDQRRLLWSGWEAVRQENDVVARREPWAEAVVALRPGLEPQYLEVTLGDAAMPAVNWNGQPLHANMWTFSTEGRVRQRLPAEQAAQLFLGRLGLINVRGSNKFHRPRLAYL